MGPDSSSSINLLTRNSQDGGRVADFLLLVSFYCLVEVLLTENRAQNKIEYDQILLSYILGNEAKRNADK